MHAKYLFKTLILSILVALGVMAVSASAAQAKWLLLRGGASVSELSLQGTLGNGALLELFGLELQIKCAGGTFTTTLKGGGTTALAGSASATFTLCDDYGNPKNCTVSSPGDVDGTIKASGSGEGLMLGEKTYLNLSSSEFTTIAYGGALCPFNEVEAVVSGSVTLTVLSATAQKTSHTVELDDNVLTSGESSAILHNGGELGGSTIIGSAQEASGSTWAIQLTGL